MVTLEVLARLVVFLDWLVYLFVNKSQYLQLVFLKLLTDLVVLCVFLHLLVHHELLTSILHENLQHQFLIFLSLQFQLLVKHLLQLVFHWVQVFQIYFLFIEDFLYLLRKWLECLQINVRDVVCNFFRHCFMICD